MCIYVMEGLRGAETNKKFWAKWKQLTAWREYMCASITRSVKKWVDLVIWNVKMCNCLFGWEKHWVYQINPWKVLISSFRNLIYWINGPFSWFMKSSYRLQHLHLVLMTFYQIWHNNHCIYMSTFTWKLNNNIESRYLVKKLGGLLKSMT